MSVAVSLTLSIVNTNNRDLLRQCLRSVRDTVLSTRHEVIVVDNASDDGSAEMVELEFPECRLIRLAQREGYGASHNHAIARAAGKYVLILNEDMEMLPGAIDTMMAKAEAIPDLGVLGCRILNADRSLQHSCFRFPTLAGELFEALFPYTLVYPECRLRSKMYEWGHDEARDVDVVVGCCMLAPRHVLEQVGRFDPAFFVYSEEHDLCKRVHDAGLRVVFTPDAEMIHFGGQTSKRMSLRMALVQLDSRTRFFRKHHGAPRALAFRVIVLLGVALRGFGWGLLRLARGPRDDAAAAKLTEYRESFKFLASWKP